MKFREKDKVGFSQNFQVLYLDKGCVTQDSRGLALCLFRGWTENGWTGPLQENIDF